MTLLLYCDIVGTEGYLHLGKADVMNCDNCGREMIKAQRWTDSIGEVEVQYRCPNCGQIEAMSYGHWSLIEEGEPQEDE